MKFLTNIDLNRNQLTNVVLHNVGSDPTGGTYSEGQLIYNTTDDQVKFYDGSAWVSVNSGSMSSFDFSDIDFLNLIWKLPSYRIISLRIFLTTISNQNKLMLSKSPQQ